jgi:hypothetical protein
MKSVWLCVAARFIAPCVRYNVPDKRDKSRSYAPLIHSQEVARA